MNQSSCKKQTKKIDCVTLSFSNKFKHYTNGTITNLCPSVPAEPRPINTSVQKNYKNTKGKKTMLTLSTVVCTLGVTSKVNLKLI